jgi:hypothetical protein
VEVAITAAAVIVPVVCGTLVPVAIGELVSVARVRAEALELRARHEQLGRELLASIALQDAF